MSIAPAGISAEAPSIVRFAPPSINVRRGETGPSLGPAGRVIEIFEIDAPSGNRSVTPPVSGSVTTFAG